MGPVDLIYLDPPFNSKRAEPKSCEAYRELLQEHQELVHVTVET